MTTLPTLTSDQFLLVQQVLNLTVALMGGAALIFALLRGQLHRAYRPAMIVMAAAVGMASYHYIRLLANWGGAYAQQGDLYVATGAPFKDAYRYADWLGTVPLILSASLLVLDIGTVKSNRLMVRLAAAAVLMIVLGYPGEIEHTNMGLRAMWGLLSTVPFLYILWVLWRELASVLRFETPRVQGLFSRLRQLLLVSWSLHPLVFAFPLLGLAGPATLVVGQVGHSVADISAKVLYGFLIYAIAREKTLHNEAMEEERRLLGEKVPAAA